MELEQVQRFFESRDATGFIVELTGQPSGAKAAQFMQSGSWRHTEVDRDSYTYQRVQCEGGGEGEGETVDWVYLVTVAGKEFYLNCTGSYYSHDGTYWNDDWAFVEPREVVVTQYFAI